VVDDGLNAAVTFEFDTNGSLPVNAVTFTAGAGPAAVATAIVAAITQAKTAGKLNSSVTATPAAATAAPPRSFSSTRRCSR